MDMIPAAVNLKVLLKDGKFDENPAKATGNDVFSAAPLIADWFETIKLNYGVDYQNGPAPVTLIRCRLYGINFMIF